MERFDKFTEYLEEKLYRHSYAFLDNGCKTELIDWVTNHDRFGKYEIVIGESNSYQTRIDLIGKEAYSY